MKTQSLLNHCIELLGQIERSRSTPADELVSAYTRARKYLGAKERRALSEIVFATLRTKNTAEHCSALLCNHDHHPTAAHALIGAIAGVARRWASFDAAPLLSSAAATPIDLFTELELLSTAVLGCQLPSDWALQLEHMLQELDNPAPEISALALASCLPAWIVEHLLNHGFDAPTIHRLGRSLILPAPFTLRVVSPPNDRNSIISLLGAEGISARPTPYSPAGIILDERVRLIDHALYRTAAIEVQDEGSQLVSYALAPKEHWRILDACAGAGGKTLHLAALQNDRGSIVASDIDTARLVNLRRRLRRYRYRSIEIRLVERRKVQPAQRFDAVLLDVPCSGFGTVRRSPEIKWRLQPAQLKRIVAKQQKILDTYVPYVRSGGVLVYATCSILPAENQCVLERFLEQHPEFVPDPLAPAFAQYGIPLAVEPDQWFIQLFPHLHGTDGFFIARMRRL
ncbi:MAG: hypothetical protein RML15_04005 [Bacteroidota bacterium]|nr:hypothetical protein [Candidatus Kapabacteria bacterium]MCS7302677.1 hypothetical protein [Candidatus Kapabacteria bacterium]MDW8074921.1 hypothetical protein [Bacteroidota bacterium]MDW8271560.1 hypothetical protein [Bacteroidota bacterium]